jgi:hypothetical protein
MTEHSKFSSSSVPEICPQSTSLEAEEAYFHLLSAYQEKIPARNEIYAHAPRFLGR